MSERIFGIIPARGGSKGLPRKNIIDLDGLPLIAHTLRAAQAANCFTDLIVSTDDVEIAAVAQQYGGHVPFIRPLELATDTATSAGVVAHALAKREAALGQPFDLIMLLQPTAPLRAAKDILAALRLYRLLEPDAVVSYHMVESAHPFYMVLLDNHSTPEPIIDNQPENMTRRQQFPPVYLRNGAIYLVRRDVFVETGSFYGTDYRAYVMPAERSVNIDSALDLAFAEALIAQQRPGR